VYSWGKQSGREASGPAREIYLCGPGGADGSGVLHYETEIDLSRTGISDVLTAFSGNPSSLYINAHTSDAPGGAIRSQLQRTDRMDYQVTWTPDQEVPPITGLTASAPSRLTVYTLRNADGTIAAGAVREVRCECPPMGMYNLAGYSALERWLTRRTR